MTTRQLLNLMGSALLASAALLVVLALIHQGVSEGDVFYDTLGNEVQVDYGLSVTFLLFSLAGVALLNGGILLLAARRTQR